LKTVIEQLLKLACSGYSFLAAWTIDGISFDHCATFTGTIQAVTAN